MARKRHQDYTVNTEEFLEEAIKRSERGCSKICIRQGRLFAGQLAVWPDVGLDTQMWLDSAFEVDSQLRQRQILDRSTFRKR